MLPPLPVSRKKNALEHALIEVFESVRPAFADPRVFDRFQRLAFGLFAVEGRRTITALMEATGRADRDWSADYRVFSRDAWEPREVFARLLPALLALHPKNRPTIVASLDDTYVKKTGTRIPGVAYRRDPMSPPFQTNLMRAQRFLQASLTVPFNDGPSPARAIPVAFDHAPSAGKLPKGASDLEKAAHRGRERAQSLSAYALNAIARLRANLDSSDATLATLLVAVDGSYTNQKVLKHLPHRTHLIGRIRKDAVLNHHPVARHDERGRPRSYGETITPEQLRHDESALWVSIKIFGAGREHDCDVKEISSLLWRKTGAELPLRLIVIRPLAYRPSNKTRLFYRKPAFLITSDLNSSLQTLVQAYFWRWDIEVNHRDEKQLLGVGHAQVRSARSVERAPAFAVACYSMLLIAAANAYGASAAKPITNRAKWLATSTARQTRLSTAQLLIRFRQETGSSILRSNPPNFCHFASHVARHLKLPKSSISPLEAIRYAMN